MSPRPASRVKGLKRTLIREIFESAPKDAINLGLGQPDLRPPDALSSALAKAASAGPAGYGPTQGDAALRAEVASSYPGFARDGADVLITTGCQQATFVVLGALLDPGDEILVPDPGFPGAPRAADAWGASARAYPLRPENHFHLDPDEVLRAVGERTRAILVISPSNPTGTVESRESLDRLATGCAERDLTLVLDDTYRELHWLDEGPAPGAPAEPAEHVVVCGGLSKSVALTGWRVGWAISPDTDFMARLVALQQTVLTCAATPIQLAAREAFSAAGRRGGAELRARFLARKNMVEESLGPLLETRMAPLEGAFYAWIDVAQRGGARHFARTLLEEEKIVVIPGEAFGAAAPDWIRVSYAQDETLLARALRVIAARAG